MAYICGVARNCAAYLPAVLANMQKVAGLFDDYKIIIVVAADSIEDIDILTVFANQWVEKVILYVDDAPVSSIRTVNIARARNICLQIMRKLGKTACNMPYFIMMDCDDVCSAPINCDILANVLNECEHWDAVSFNREPYYDIWALSVPPFIFSYSNFVSGKRKWANHLQTLFKEKDGDWVPVWSAFGGFAIYKTNIFLAHKDIIYDGTYRLDYIPAALLSQNIHAAGSPIYGRQTAITPFVESGADCEHRYFHLTAVLKHGAKIFIHRGLLF